MSKSYDNILSNLKQTPPRELHDHILVVDAMNTFIRSFSMLKAMNPQGHHIGGLVGFLRSLGYVTRIFEPTRILCVFDGKGSSVNRKNIDPNYKAHRTNTRITNWGMFDSKAEEYESLAAQVDRLKYYLDCLPVHSLEMEKLEADDIIAYMALQASKSNKKITIVSSDKDFLQLVNKNVEVYSPIKKTVINTDNIKDHIGVLPENYSIVKALLGDNSDGLSGVKGLGLKTIIKEFPLMSRKPVSGLQYIYDICEKRLEDKKIFAKILHNWGKVETNYDLMNLHEGLLDNSEKNHIFDTIKDNVPNLQVGAFLHLLDTDKIEGITKNTEGWLQNFRGLTVFK